ncbi:hypothetical protein ACFV2H_46140 [Streptomyces sp. NPDC059629]|uniref:hypothetical protein n=1 Tax=Streptomyces sp. NPDC059629 TaxID=3346889 RepID=UPI003692DB9D
MSLTVYERLADSPSVQLAPSPTPLPSSTPRACTPTGPRTTSTMPPPEARQLTVAERARVRTDTAVAAIRSREAVDRLVSVSGASAFALASPLQRIRRGLGTASRHGVVNPGLGREIYGHSLLGIDAQPRFIV